MGALATYAPLIRGLKRASGAGLCPVRTALATYAPLIRGLKHCNLRRVGIHRGTPLLATYAPLIRGLKRSVRRSWCSPYSTGSQRMPRLLGD